MPLCDDCGKTYLPPDYYTFTQEGCEIANVPHECTGNLCPECAGPFLDPDDPADPRRP